MIFLSNYWWIFLTLSVACYILAIASQLRSMNKLVTSSINDNMFSGMLSGVLVAAIFGITGTVSGLLFIIGAIVAIIHAVK